MNVCIPLKKMFQGKETELGCAMAETVICRSLAAEAAVRSEAISVSGGRSGIG